jgi:hypothetical protein
LIYNLFRGSALPQEEGANAPLHFGVSFFPCPLPPILRELLSCVGVDEVFTFFTFLEDI